MAHNKKRVLVIDDDDDVCRIVKEKFGSLDYEVLSAHDAKEGFQKTLEGKPDCVLLDIRIPKSEDGLAYLHGIRSFCHADPKEQARMRKTPVFILTGAGTSLQTLFESEGISGFIEKPFDVATLHNKIQGVL